MARRGTNPTTHLSPDRDYRFLKYHPALHWVPSRKKPGCVGLGFNLIVLIPVLWSIWIEFHMAYIAECLSPSPPFSSMTGHQDISWSRLVLVPSPQYKVPISLRLRVMLWDYFVIGWIWISRFQSTFTHEMHWLKDSKSKAIHKCLYKSISCILGWNAVRFKQI